MSGIAAATTIPHLELVINPPGADLSTEPDRVKKIALQIPTVAHLPILPSELSCTQIQGGITNRLYRVDYSYTLGKDQDPIKPVLVRVYGEGSDLFIDRSVDTAVFAELTQCRFGASLIATLVDGRVEQFMVGCRTLDPDDLSKASISKLIARRMCDLHHLKISSCITPKIKRTIASNSGVTDFEKQARTSQLNSSVGPAESVESSCVSSAASATKSETQPILITRLREWHQIALSLKFNAHSDSAEERNKATKYAALPLKEIGVDIESVIQSRVMAIPSPTVFCHNDLLAGNILVRGEDESEVVFVDVEYAGYNPRGFDIGNHFCEFSGFDYSLFKEKFPNKEAQIIFLKSYLTRKYEIETGSDSPSEEGPGDAELEDFYHECNAYAIASHLFWGLWAVIQARHSVVDFDYLEYAKARFDAYFGEKARISSEGII